METPGHWQNGHCSDRIDFYVTSTNFDNKSGSLSLACHSARSTSQRSTFFGTRPYSSSTMYFRYTCSHHDSEGKGTCLILTESLVACNDTVTSINLAYLLPFIVHAIVHALLPCTFVAHYIRSFNIVFSHVERSATLHIPQIY